MEGKRSAAGRRAAGQGQRRALTRGLKFSRFTGKPGQMLEVLAPSGIKASRLLLVGLGKAEALDEKSLETLGAQIVGRLYTAGESAANIEIDVPKGARSRRPNWRRTWPSGRS